jgi:biopolymer transport protein ExbD
MAVRLGARPQRGIHRRKSHPMAEINVTPMVDVMLVLLVIFMITAPLLTVGVPVDLPKTKAEAMQDPDEPLVVSINKEGQDFPSGSGTYRRAARPQSCRNLEQQSRSEDFHPRRPGGELRQDRRGAGPAGLGRLPALGADLRLCRAAAGRWCPAGRRRAERADPVTTKREQ